MTDMQAPERVRRVSNAKISNLRTAIREVKAYAVGPTDRMDRDLEELCRHVDAVNTFANRMTFGSAVAGHTEDVLDWLIEQGWTPPAGLIVDEPKEEQ